MGDNVNILLLEDDEIDAEEVTRALRRRQIDHPLHVARDGLEGLAWLRGEGGANKLAPPHLILLDINMPRMNGIEFLEALRADDHLRRSVVFMLTTSNSEEDKRLAYGLNAAGYLLKSGRSDLNGGFESLIDSYLRTVALPN
ncbi:response regulator [Paroceanicella profunda]|uniref:Response regulator n=1 Tax=Paroceanicella profunda TaxID=2579971 RepID=A0A5B8FIW5_9RHOB|nr:response regulator [Paroceanicella profunda]